MHGEAVNAAAASGASAGVRCSTQLCIAQQLGAQQLLIWVYSRMLCQTALSQHLLV
jgi:hypothetical protein